MRLETAVRKRLGKLPTDLRELYNDAYVQRFDAYEDEEKSVAKGELHLLMCLQVPLSSRNFIRAVSSHRMERTELCKDDLLDLCANFIVLDTGLGVFRFAHLFVREFLETKGGYKSGRSHAFAARSCIDCLFMKSHTRTICTVSDTDEFKALWNDMAYKDIAPSTDTLSESEGGIADEEDIFSADHAFLNDFHAYTCLYWSCHLFES